MIAVTSSSNVPQWRSWLWRVWPGVVLCGLVALTATTINDHVPLVSAMLVAIVAGVAARNFRVVPAAAEPGLALTGKTLLRLGVVLLGLRLSLRAVAALGWGALGVIALTVVAVFAVTVWVGPRLGVPHATTVLTATGTAICGTAALLVLPLLVRWLGLEATPAGVWVGASVHEVGQVVAAGGLISPEALDVAVVAKLGRVVLLAPLIAVVGALEARRAARLSGQAGDGGTSRRSGFARNRGSAPLVPWFVIGFVVSVLLRTLTEGSVPGTFFEWGSAVASFLLTMAMFAMGAAVDLRRLARGGGRALALGAVAAVVSALVSLLGVLVLVR